MRRSWEGYRGRGRLLTRFLAQFGKTRREADALMRGSWARGWRRAAGRTWWWGPHSESGRLGPGPPAAPAGGQGVSDERVLGSGEFIEPLRADAAHQERETLRLTQKVVPLATVARTLCAHEGGLRPISMPGFAVDGWSMCAGSSAKSRCGAWGTRERQSRGSWASQRRRSIGSWRRRHCPKRRSF